MSPNTAPNQMAATEAQPDDEFDALVYKASLGDRHARENDPVLRWLSGNHSEPELFVERA